MNNHIKRLLSSNDVMMVIANSDGKLQPSLKHHKYTTNLTGSTEFLPVNLCGNHFQQRSYGSTPAILGNAPDNEVDYKNPWEKIRGRYSEPPTSCKDVFMKGLSPMWPTACNYIVSGKTNICAINRFLLNRWCSLCPVKFQS